MPDGGKWVFTSLVELDDIIRQWTAICAALQARRQAVHRTLQLIHPPAPDVMSAVQAQAFARSMRALDHHTSELFGYAEKYQAKLMAARDKYSSTEQEIASRFDGAHG